MRTVRIDFTNQSVSLSGWHIGRPAGRTPDDTAHHQPAGGNGGF